MAIIFLVSLIGSATISAQQPLPMAFNPVAVQYSKTLDRLVMISANPNQVHLVDPVNGTQTLINLNLPPLSLSVSPDGTHAAVGHDGWISYVNLSLGYVENNLAVSLTASTVILAANGDIWVPPSATVNVATGIQSTSNSSPYGTTHPALHPNGYWIYSTDDNSSPDILNKGDMSSGIFQFLYIYPYFGDFPSCGNIFYSADGNRLLTGCGTLFRTTASKTDDMTYSGALSGSPQVTAGADSAITHQFVVIPGNSFNTTTNDTAIQFYDDQYLTLLGQVPLPVYTSASVSAPWHGRYLFYSPDSTKLYIVLQADPKANLTNDYAIYYVTLSTGSGCNPKLLTNTGNVAADGGTVDVTVTATAGCLWQASTSATWLSIGAGGVSDGNGAVTIVANPNLQTTKRAATVTIAGLTYTVTQDAAAAPGVNPVTVSPVRPVDANYSAALDRMILVSSNPNVLTILNPVTGASQGVSLAMPPTALSISWDGLYAAVGHDGLISYVNLTTAVVEKTLPVTTTVYELALSATEVFAFPLTDQWEAVRVVNIASGIETLWNWIYAGSTGGAITPNGQYLYINATKRYDVTQPLPSAFDAIDTGSPRQWFSQDGSRLFSGSGQEFRLSSVASQDLQYGGTLETGGLSAVADSSVQQATAIVATGSTNDTAIAFFGQQYLAQIGSISIPKFTVGLNSYAAHGRYLFWNAAGNLLFAIIQADPTSGILNDYSIYTVSLNGGCNISFPTSSANPPAAGGTFTVGVTASAGCAWKATSNSSWLTISANALSAGPATISYIVDPNPTLSARTGTITVAGKTFMVTQAAGAQVQVSALTTLPFRAVDAAYSTALDRIIAISGNPNRLNIYNPATGTNTTVALPLPGIALSVAPSGLQAAVCHDALVSIVNLQTATISKSLTASVDCYDVVLAGNGYVYLSVAASWGTMDSVNIATGAETTAPLLYDGINFQLDPAGDAIYTSDTETSGESVTRFSIAGGPMQEAYQSAVYPAQPIGNRLWFTTDGRMAGDSGNVFRTGSTLATDFIYTGTLSGYSGYEGSIGALAHSTLSQLFASVGTSSSSVGDETLFLHGDTYLALESKLTLPQMTAGSVSAATHGKFVFWDSTGKKAYVILQADPSAGFQNDFGVYTLSPAFTPGCAVTLGTNSTTSGGLGGSGGIAVSAAASNCVWGVASNASWIQIYSGAMGVGIGDVSYSVSINSSSAMRTGTITIGNQTFTITQAGFVPVSQTITFGALNNKTTTTAPFALSATATSGLAVTFTSNSTAVCTVSGVDVTLISAGTCSITASQAGSSVYAAATPVTRTFTVFAPPAIVSVSPGSGTGTSVTFKAVYSDPNGAANLSELLLQINSSQSGGNACYVYYQPQGNHLYLANNAGAWITPALTPGVAGTASNSQCALNAGSSSVSTAGNNLTLSVALNFTGTVVGSKNVYLYAAGLSGLNSGWVKGGTWVPTSAGPPAVVSLSPDSGTGASVTFKAVYSDPNGAVDLSEVLLQINTGQSSANACYVYYQPQGNHLYLATNAGNAWTMAALTPGVAGMASNSQCTLNAGSSSVTVAGDDLTLNLALSFSGTFTGAKHVYLYAAGFSGQKSGWVGKGTWVP